jgi:O-antigen ligase
VTPSPMNILVPLIVSLVPLVISPGLLLHFDTTPKLAILIYGVSILLLFFRAGRSSLARVWKSWTGRCFCVVLGLQLISLTISTLLSVDTFLSLNGSEWRGSGLYTWIALVVFIVMTSAWFHKSQNLSLALRWCVPTGSLIAIYTIAQYFGWDPFLPAAAYHAGEGLYTIVRPPGTLGHADYLASFLIYAVFASIALSRVPGPAWQKAASRSAALLACAAIVLTGTRSGLLGLAAGMTIFLICNWRQSRRLHVAATFIAVLLGATAFVLSPAGAKLRARAHWSMEDPLGGARPLLWRDAMRMIATRPAGGFGPETFVREFPRFQSIELARAYPDFFHESPHNILLDAVASQGVAGGIILVTAWCIALYCGIKAWRNQHPLASPLLAGSVAMLVSHQFTVFVPATALMFFLLQAMLVGIAQDSSSDPAVDWHPTAAWSYAAVASILAGALAVHATQLVVADRALAIARERIEAGDVTEARHAHETAMRWSPVGGQAELHYSRAMTDLAGKLTTAEQRKEAWREALAAGVRAVSDSEQRANAWYSLAMLFAAHNDQKSVERCLRNTIAWAPNWFKPHWALAQLLEIDHRYQEAVGEAATAVDRNGWKHPEVIVTWIGLTNRVQP